MLRALRRVRKQRALLRRPRYIRSAPRLSRVALRGARDGPEEARTLGAALPSLRNAALLAPVAAAVVCRVVGLSRQSAGAAIAGAIEHCLGGGGRRERRALAAAVSVAIATPSSTPKAGDLRMCQHNAATLRRPAALPRALQRTSTVAVSVAVSVAVPVSVTTDRSRRR